MFTVCVISICFLHFVSVNSFITEVAAFDVEELGLFNESIKPACDLLGVDVKF